RKQITMDYYIYHDESKEQGYWHGIYLVPVKTKQILLNKIKEIRTNTGDKHVVGLKRVNKMNNRVYSITSAFLQLGIASLVQDFKGKTYPIHLGKRKFRQGKKPKKDYSL